jgi:uncharacterized repeat protein (TIGR01451 family)
MPAAPAPSSPLLFVRVLGPAGMRVTFHPGTAQAVVFQTPVEVGLRPGYPARIELSNLPLLPGVKLYPSLEVRGALYLPMDKAARHPVPLVFTEDEFRRVMDKGSTWTKVHYLEDPAQAAPLPTTPNEPPVTDVLPERDPLREARLRGRPMVVVRFGDRQPAPDELARSTIPNTMLLPGQSRLGLPPVPPPLSWFFWPIYDPAIGPRIGNEECVPDGGDTGNRIGIAPGGRLGGLDPSDTAIEYSSTNGNRHVAVSNRVCICVPRFAVLRSEFVPFDMAVRQGTTATRNMNMTNTIRREQPAARANAVTALDSAVTRQRASGMQTRVLLHGYDQIKETRITATVAGSKVTGVVREPDEIEAFPFCEPISLFKWAEPKEAQIGDVVTFFLRYHNHTKQPVDNLVVSDSLSARLEFIPGSARSDREASMTVEANEAGSSILRWHINGQLLPEQSGVIAFQARVR